MKKRIAVATLVCAMTFPVFPMHAANRDMVQLQTQVQQLQDAVARLQQSNDERMGVLKDLVQQTADSVNRMTLNMDALQKKVTAQSEASGTKVDQVSVQVQTLADAVDELKARLGRMEKLLQDVQSQQQNMRLDGGGAPGAAAFSSAAPMGASAEVAPAPTKKSSNEGAGAPIVQEEATAPAPSAPPVKDLYETAYGDYVGGKYPLASAEFNDIIKFYPDSPLAGNSYFYLGEIAMKTNKPSVAAKSYDHVLEQYPGNTKVPVSHLRKAEALIAMKQTDAGARELRSLIQRFPNSPEAARARTKLSALGFSPRAR
ncbi:MAG: tetratricopeptide repeat protein [Acidobacteria bacterium]|nr:tetratricopeptide repeat protein [Acidobacteriota bacterium]